MCCVQESICPVHFDKVFAILGVCGYAIYGTGDGRFTNMLPRDEALNKYS